MKKFFKKLDENLSIIPRFFIVLIRAVILIPIYPILLWDLLKDKDDSIIARYLRSEFVNIEMEDK